MLGPPECVASPLGIRRRRIPQTTARRSRAVVGPPRALPIGRTRDRLADAADQSSGPPLSGWAPAIRAPGKPGTLIARTAATTPSHPPLQSRRQARPQHDWRRSRPVVVPHPPLLSLLSPGAPITPAISPPAKTQSDWRHSRPVALPLPPLLLFPKPRRGNHHQPSAPHQAPVSLSVCGGTSP